MYNFNHYSNDFDEEEEYEDESEEEEEDYDDEDPYGEDFEDPYGDDEDLNEDYKDDGEYASPKYESEYNNEFLKKMDNFTYGLSKKRMLKKAKRNAIAHGFMTLRTNECPECKERTFYAVSLGKATLHKILDHIVGLWVPPVSSTSSIRFACFNPNCKKSFVTRRIVWRESIFPTSAGLRYPITNPYTGKRIHHLTPYKSTFYIDK